VGRIVDQLQDHRWRIKLRGHYKRLVVVEPEYVTPYKSLLEEEGSSSSSIADNEDDSAVEEAKDDDDGALRTVEDVFGSWQLHTTGFASRMMKKMGYVEVTLVLKQ
jgi:hypothetical protein